MIKKRFLSILLTGVMVVTTLFSGVTTTAVSAAEMPTPDYTFDFEDSLGAATAWLRNGMDPYTGEISYAEGRTAGTKAVALGSYGLRLNVTRLGLDYTVSLWVRPNGTIAEHSPIVAIGDNGDFGWVAFAGAAGNNQNCKFWTDGTNLAGEKVGHRLHGTGDIVLPRETWTMVTIVGSGDRQSLYMNGELVRSGDGMPTQIEEYQDIFLGVNYWDALFSGRIDDVKIYKQALTAGQVSYLHDPTGGSNLLNTEGFEAPESVAMQVGAKRELHLTMASKIVLSEPQITYVSADPSIATVNADGIVTGVATGSTTITTTVSLEGVVKTDTTTVTVSAVPSPARTMVANYDLSGATAGQLMDTSGYGNHATIKGASSVSFVQDAGVPVMNIADADGYVELPLGIMDDLKDQEAFAIEMTYSRSADSGPAAWLLGLGSKVQAAGANYLFYAPSFQGGAIRTGMHNGNSERLIATTATQNVDQYYKTILVFNHGTMQVFVDGLMVGETLETSNNFMRDVVIPGTENGVLGFIGKSVWSADTNFVGKIKSFKIYDRAMSSDEIQGADLDEYNAILKKELDDSSQDWSFLGKDNPSFDAVSFNLSTLPAMVGETPIVWTSSNPAVLSDSGVVTNGATDQVVDLTATITSGRLTANKVFRITVKAADKAVLNTVLASAKAVERNIYTPNTLAALNTAIAAAESAVTQKQADDAVTALNRAISRLVYNDLYENPWEYYEGVAVPVKTVQIKKGVSRTLFTLPEDLRGAFEMEYTSFNPGVVTYENGVIKGIKAGKTTVVMKLTAANENDDRSEEYLTEVTVTEDAQKVVGLDKVTAKAKATRLAKGKKTQITVAYPATVKAAAPKVSYKASGAVSVNSKGRVTAKKAGTGKITVTVTVSTGEKVTRTITVRVGAITGKSSVKVGKSITLRQKGLTGKVKWSVNRKKVATISKKGKLKAKKKGKVVVTATVGKVKIKKTVNIKK